MSRVLAFALVLLSALTVSMAASTLAEAAPLSAASAQSTNGPDPGGGNEEPPKPTNPGEEEPPPTKPSRAVERYDRFVERVSERLGRSGSPAARRAAERFNETAERARERLCQRPRVRC